MRGLSPQRDEIVRDGRAFVLASASPRRASLLADAGQRFEVEPSGADEAAAVGEMPRAFASRVARDKALAVARRRPGVWVLGADTIVVVDGEILGKPADRAEAVAMLGRLSGRRHEVCTAFAVVAPDGVAFASDVVVTEVTFRALSPDEIRAYVQTGEPLDKAGAYAIQGGAKEFVVSIDGSLTNVIGLPMDEVERALRAAGVWRETKALA